MENNTQGNIKMATIQPFYPPVGSRAGAVARGASNQWWNDVLREREQKKQPKNLTIPDRSQNGGFWDRVNDGKGD